MTEALMFGTIAAIAATVIVLIAGLISMSKGGKFNDKWGNRLMRARVVLQGLTVVLIAVMFFAA